MVVEKAFELQLSRHHSAIPSICDGYIPYNQVSICSNSAEEKSSPAISVYLSKPLSDFLRLITES